MQEESDRKDADVRLSVSDLRQAATDGIISATDVEKIIQWAADRQSESTSTVTPTAEQAKGLNLVTVAYYFGAMLMISACAWFLGDKWDSLGSVGVLITSTIYFVIAAGVGWWLRGKGYVVGGGLLITVA